MNYEPLTYEETNEAMKELNVPVHKYRKVCRNYCDEPLPGQSIGLISFVPVVGATPDKNGIYGYAKLRGVFATEEAAKSHARTLIEKHDSMSKIYHVVMGNPFPFTARSDYSSVVDEVKTEEELEAIQTENNRKERAKIKEIKQREKNLLKSADEEEDPLDRYIDTRNKKASLTNLIVQYCDAVKEKIEALNNAKKEIKIMDEKYPNFQNEYLQKYMEGRKEAGLKNNGESDMVGILKYLIEDIEIDNINTILKLSTAEERKST